MEVRALCIRMLITVLVLLLSAQVQHSYSHQADASFPRIVLSRLQFFEYESVVINCEGFFNESTEWRVIKKINDKTTICNVKWEETGACKITPAFTVDSGEYWCEAEGKKSSIVNIVVTAGSVILESPALPVMEGDDVILRCRNKTTSNLKADFYKDGHPIRSNSPSGEITIHSVSKSDEGHYKCSISGAGESAESWLAVRVRPVILKSPHLPVVEGNNITLHCRSMETSNVTVHFYKDGILIRSSTTRNMTIHTVSKSNGGLYKCSISGVGESEETLVAVTNIPDNLFTHVFTLVIAVSLVAFLLLLVVGLCHWYKGASTSHTYIPTSSPQQAVSAETDEIIYAAVTIPRKKNDTSEAQLQQATNVNVTTQEPKTRRDEDESLASSVYHTLSLVPSESVNPR